MAKNRNRRANVGKSNPKLYAARFDCYCMCVRCGKDGTITNEELR
jgi:hypothetical protein